MSWIDDAEKKRREKEIEAKEIAKQIEEERYRFWQSHKQEITQFFDDIRRVLKSREGQDGIKRIIITTHELNYTSTLSWHIPFRVPMRFLTVEVFPNKFGVDLIITQFNKKRDAEFKSIYKSDQIMSIDALKSTIAEYWEKWTDLGLDNDRKVSDKHPLYKGSKCP